MNPSQELQFAFVLHTRPWRETSLIVEFFTKNHGKIALCARGVRSKKSPKRSILQPLTPLVICWKGRGELPTLTKIEATEKFIKLSGDAFYSSFYLNELLVRLLHRHDPHPELFSHYKLALEQLILAERLEVTLREFELALLQSIGYGLTLDRDHNDDLIDEGQNYLLHIDGLLQPVVDNNQDQVVGSRVFSGGQLISIAERDWHDRKVLQDAKRLLRLSLKALLGDKPLESKKLFRRKTS
ncbi:MAG: DNA repair protein RecO [Gammaproteobacteria bacterium]|nr:MAG: DNA repair protein RecO [Gammaproteobacteria bacterium]